MTEKAKHAAALFGGLGRTVRRSQPRRKRRIIKKKKKPETELSIDELQQLSEEEQLSLALKMAKQPAIPSQPPTAAEQDDQVSAFGFSLGEPQQPSGFN